MAAPDWAIQNHPQIANCVCSVSEIVRQMRRYKSCELEARFGKWKNNKFTSGVSRQQMDTIIDSLKQSCFIHCDGEWSEQQDFFFMSEDKHMRTRVIYDSDKMKITSNTIHKLPISSKIFTTNSHFPDIRVDLKLEEAITNPPDVVQPTTVRIKQSRRFYIENKKGRVWAYDFSMTWTGKTKTEAELLQMKEDPVFEIECELLNYDDYVYKNTDMYIAASILLKMTDLFNSMSESILQPYFPHGVHKSKETHLNYLESSLESAILLTHEKDSNLFPM